MLFVYLIFEIYSTDQNTVAGNVQLDLVCIITRTLKYNSRYSGEIGKRSISLRVIQSSKPFNLEHSIWNKNNKKIKLKYNVPFKQDQKNTKTIQKENKKTIKHPKKID